MLQLTTVVRAKAACAIGYRVPWRATRFAAPTRSSRSAKACARTSFRAASRLVALQLIPNAVDVANFSFGVPADPDLRNRLGLNGATVLGFAGSFYGYEGLDLLLDAAARLAPQRPELRVLLVGGGPQEDALRRQAASLGLTDRVIFTGRVPHAQVQHYYQLIDVLVYPRHSMRLTELVTPLKPLEAMAQGRMFVASDVGGHKELVRDGDTGVLFPAGDAGALAQTITRVLDTRADWSGMLRRARRFVETERTWARSVIGYADVYAAVLAARGRTELVGAPVGRP